jgi:Ser/Thr protein kinase RdoA (MazF antagonist)
VATVIDAVAESLQEPVSLVSELDVDVYRLHRAGGEPDLVVRAFGSAVERESVNAAVQVLQALASTRFPAERCALDAPMLSIGDGRHLLVTEFVVATPAPRPGFVAAWCAALLGQLAKRSGDRLAAGGGWHRLGATPSREIDEALRIGGELGPSVAELLDALAAADDGAGLPECLIHADLTPPNAVPQGDGPPVVIDWIGVGRGPRIWPLAFLLFAAGPELARRGLDRYCRSISLTDEERQRLPGIMIARPLSLDLWSVACERMSAQQAVSRARAHQARINAISAALDATEER